MLNYCLKNVNALIYFILGTCILSCTTSPTAYSEGRYLFEVNCSSCHGKNAEGLGSWYPSLMDTEFIKANRIYLSSFIKNGIRNDSNSFHKLRLGNVEMPANKSLKDADICNILNYLNDRFWRLEPFTLQEIKSDKSPDLQLK